MRAPSSRQRVDRLGEARRPTERQHRLAPAEQVARALAARRHRHARRWLRFPRQLERPRPDEPALPVARREVGRRPVLRQLAGLHELGPPLVGLAPQEVGGLGEVARLVEHEERAGIDVIERGRGRQLGGPDLGRVADRHRPGCAGRDRAERVVRRALEAGEVRPEPLAEPRHRLAEPLADRGHAPGREQELRRGQEDDALDRSGRPLVGRIERAQRVDLVTEELDPDRQLHRRREDVHDAAAPRELATAGDLGHRRVAEVEQVAQELVLVEPRADAQLTRLGGQVVGRDRVLEQGLDAGDQDPGPSARATPPGPRPGPPSRPRRARCARRRGRSAAREPRRRPRRPARPELLGHAVADLGVAGDPDERLAGRDGGRQVRLGAVGHGDEPGVSPDPTDVGAGSRVVPAARRTCPSQRAAAAGRRGPAGDGPRRYAAPIPPCPCGWLWPVGPSLAISRSEHLAPSRILDLGVDRADIEVDGVLVPDAWVPCREVLGDLLGDATVPPAASAQGRRGRLRHRPTCPCAAGLAAIRSSSGGRRSRPAARRPRPERRADPRRPRAAGTC